MVDNNRIPHALLIEGRSGIGKFMMARALAQYIHCTSRVNGDSCGICPACKQHQSLNHVDTCFSFPVIKAKNKSGNPISDDYTRQWREFLDKSPYMQFSEWLDLLGNANAQPKMYVEESVSLIRKLNFTAHAAKYKIVLMWLPERMNEECANKLLKLIEEPHNDTIFILVSDEPSKILPTIYSRLRRIEMKRMPDSVIERELTEKFSVDPLMAQSIAHLSEGSMLDAFMRLNVTDDAQQQLAFFISLMRNAYQRNIRKLKTWSEDVAAMGREKIMSFLGYCERLIGENYIYNLQHPELVYLSAEESNFSRNFARFINVNNVMKLRKTFMDARLDIAGNANSKIVLFDVAIKVILYLKQ